MGLHLNYELRLPAATSDKQVSAQLSALHDFALTLSFREVSPLVSVGSGGTASGHEWIPAMTFMAKIISKPWEEDNPPLIGDVSSAQGFAINPGQHCETAFFGFLRRADDAGGHQEWFWHCSCKTQYASVISDAHLITCHTSLVRLLDHAIVLGIDVIVRDETFYWETRDEARLIGEVHKMNRIVASLAGKLSDAISSGHAVVAPIFEHPRFERIEIGEEDSK